MTLIRTDIGLLNMEAVAVINPPQERDSLIGGMLSHAEPGQWVIVFDMAGSMQRVVFRGTEQEMREQYAALLCMAGDVSPAHIAECEAEAEAQRKRKAAWMGRSDSGIRTLEGRGDN